MTRLFVFRSDITGNKRSMRGSGTLSGSENALWIVVFSLIILPFFELRGLNYLISDLWGDVYFYWRIASALALVVLFVMAGKRSLFCWLAIAVSLSMLLSTFLNSGIGVGWTFWQWLVDWAPLSLGVILVAVASNGRTTPLLWAIVIVCGSIVVANFIFTLVFPQGLHGLEVQERFTLIGNKNMAIFATLLGTGSSLILDFMHQRRISPMTCIVYSAGLFQCVVHYSATSAVALVLFALLVLVSRSGALRFAINGLSIGVVYMAAFISIVMLRLQDYLAVLIEGVLGKSLTFTGRTAVWDGTLSMMDAEHLLFGYGTAPRFHLEFNDFLYNHSHNDILSVLLSGGVIALVLYLVLVGWALWALYRSRALPFASVLGAMVAAYLAVALMEPLFSIAWGIALGMIYYAPKAFMSRSDCETQLE